MRRAIKRATKREIHNQLEGFKALLTGATPQFKEARTYNRKPASEREAGANDAIKEWRRYRPDVRLWRNNVGAYPLPGGGMLRYGLCNGSADFIGLATVTITPSMVGKKVAVFLAIESKAPGKDAEAHQDTWLNEVKDAGAIAGVARNAQDAEDVLARWHERVTADER